MFHPLETFGDKLRYFLLNPPLAPGGQAETSIDEFGRGHGSDDPLILRYLPLLVLLSLFWPVLLTLIAASISASAWLFWLCIGASFSFIQLLYVLYNFALIVQDISILTILKSFALLRALFRYYFYKFGDATGIGVKGRKRHGKSRTRKQWREDVDEASNYDQYSKIELFEPQQQTRDIKATAKRPKTYKRTNSTGTPRKSRFDMSLRKRNIEQKPVSSPPGRQMRRIHSSNEIDSPSQASPVNKHTSNIQFPLRRISSSALLVSESKDGNDKSLHEEELCAKWQHAVKEDLGTTGGMLLTTLSCLKEARKAERGQETVRTLLSGIVKRNHLSIDDVLKQDARSIAERGQHSLKVESRRAIDAYGQEVEKCIDWVASSAVHLAGCNVDDTHGTSREQIMDRQHEEISKRYKLLKKMKLNLGHTGLMLSGGGAQAMYHLGTVKALVESNLYEHIYVVSGTSGGSIVAAMCAIKTPAELLRDICVNTVACDYMLTGEQKRKNVSWFPSMYRMGQNFMKTGLVMDSEEFYRCCQFYYSDITFEEAYEMTGKQVCITVSASRASSGSGVQRLLLNHISTPGVTLASAVSASCSLPGAFKPTKLMIKDSRGKLVPFEIDGVEWIDGSVQADLPFKRISTLFNVNNFVVAQVNPHVVPFLNKAHHPSMKTAYWRMFQLCMWDIQRRVLNLSQLGLFPKVFGQDFSKLFKQKYYGNLTLTPRFTTMQVFMLKALANPTIEDMDNYIQSGQVAAWPYLQVLREMLHLECAVKSGLTKLDQRLKSITFRAHLMVDNDDADSLSSAPGSTYHAHLPGFPRESELLREKVRALEQENKQLRQQLADRNECQKPGNKQYWK